ncbi:MAG: M20/M25/M40 family metallo-hydrolase [Propionibacteriaceae bacterium]|nr:M20/M25/M40 family metallo-hydrolase [Propionibacteriaceae bacterium]
MTSNANDLTATIPADPALADQLMADLAQLVAIPSIGALSRHRDDLARSARLVAALARAAGATAEVVDQVAAPAVLAHWPGPEGSPTVCLYAHHDVQPVGDPALWRTDPFQTVLVGERVFGRGTADDKGAIALHLACLRAWGGRPPVGVKLFVEGEEEIGSPNLAAFLERHRQQLAADVFVVADSGNWAVGQPGLTVALRGVTGCVVELRTLDHGVHSGQFGGVVPDAWTALIRLLASLHQADGAVAVAGLESGLKFEAQHDEARFRAEAGVLESVALIGRGSIADRLWAGPAITVIGLDAVGVAEASNTLAPVARANISLRVPPTVDATAAQDRLIEHLRAHVPWGAELTITRSVCGAPALIGLDSPAARRAVQAWGEVFGTPPVPMGQGGSIPMVNGLAEAFPGSTIIASAVCDPDSRMHAPDESVHLGDLVRQVRAQSRFLELLGEDAD